MSDRIESNAASVRRRFGVAVCLVLLLAASTLTVVALRDGMTHSDRVARDLGIWGWPLYVVIAIGACFQVRAYAVVLRSQVSGVAVFRWALIIFVVTVVAYLAMFRRSDGFTVELFVGGWAAGLAFAIVRLAGRSSKPSKATFLLFQLALPVLLLELGLRGISAWSPNPLLAPEEGSVLQRIEAHSIKPGYVHYGFPHNSHGFYDEEFEAPAGRSGRVVAVIGDSFSLSFVPHRAHYTTVCERELEDVAVYNIGVGACGPEEYRQLLIADAQPLQPDAVVVAVFVGNDLSDLQLHTTGKNVQSWFDRGSCRLYLAFHRLLRLARERDRGGAAWTSNTHELLTTEAAITAAFPWYADPLKDPGSFSQDAYLEFVTERIPVACAPDPVRVNALVDVMASMRSIAGKPFGVMLIPAEYQVEDAVWRAGVEVLGNGEFDRNEPQIALRAELERRGIPCLDLLPLCREQTPFADGDRHLYRLRDTHFGVLGNRLAGRALAGFVRRLLGE